LDPEPSLNFAYTVDTELVFGFIGIAVLLFCSAVVSGAEVALFSLSQKDFQRKNSRGPFRKTKKIIGNAFSG
jgi:CBS domain containing-hemolysin-like protein